MLFRSLPLYFAVCNPPGANRNGLTCSTAGQRSAMARAFSRVSGLRRRSSRVALPMAAVLVTITVVGPKLRNSPVTAPSKPAMMEPTPITAPVPMITPSTVRKLRILCSTTEFRARRIPEFKDPRVISFLRAQCLDGVEVRRSPCRVNAEEEPYHRRKRHPHHHGAGRHRHGNRGEGAHEH